MNEYLPWTKVFKWIAFSALVTSTLVGTSLFYWNYYQRELASNSYYNIVALWQVCCHKEPLQTDFLAELLDLSSDQPTNLYQFDLKAAKQKLLAYPIIKTAKIKKVKPGMLHIEYAMRQPIAYLPEYSNTAIDKDGVLIPSKPFYTPKNLYELVLGLPKGLSWGTKISGIRIDLVRSIIKTLSQHDLEESFHLTRIDVSKAFSKRYSEREIVINLEEPLENDRSDNTVKSIQIVLRFSPDNWPEQLLNYKALRQLLIAEALAANHDVPLQYVVDMRISQLAFLAR